jgi:hypothetical protein
MALLNTAQTQTATCEVDPSGRKNPPSSKVFLNVSPLKQRRAQGTHNRHILKNASLAFDTQCHNFFSY